MSLRARAVLANTKVAIEKEKAKINVYCNSRSDVITVMSIMKLVQHAAISDLYIGSNVHLRKELCNQQLDGVKVAVLHNDARAVLVSKILQDHGAQVEHFSVKGEKAPHLINIRELNLKNEKADKTYLENVLRKVDIFLDGIGSDKMEAFGLKHTDLAKKNGQLLVATVDDADAFAAMNTMKSLAICLYLREKHTAGQVVDQVDSKKYLSSLDTFMKNAN